MEGTIVDSFIAGWSLSRPRPPPLSVHVRSAKKVINNCDKKELSDGATRIYIWIGNLERKVEKRVDAFTL